MMRRQIGCSQLSWKDIQKKNNDEIVLVNKNRLYWAMSLSTRCIDNNKKLQEISTLHKRALGRVRDERKLFVPMTVKEIKDSFGGQLEQMPYNSFRQAGERDKSAFRRYVTNQQEAHILATTGRLKEHMPK